MTGKILLILVAIATWTQAKLEWSGLPDLPDAHGFAGSFAGSSGGALLVAGGANFPDAAPWEGGTKVWHDGIYLLRAGAGQWMQAGHLPQALGYGVSVTTPEGLVCIGGSDSKGHHTEVFRLRWTGEKVERETLPPLPLPLANMAGALVGNEIHVAGGIERPDDVTALARHFVFSKGAWQEAEPLPGPGRILPVAGARDGKFYLFSGAALEPDGKGGIQRRYLRDAWSYSRDKGWQKLADMPRAAVAAPTPAPLAGVFHLLVLGGDDGTLVGYEPPDKHPGFPREVLAYDIVTDTWTKVDRVPAGLPASVTAPVVPWQGGDVVVSGEIRPGVRTPGLLQLKILNSRAPFGWVNWSVVTAYLAGMIGVGVFFMKREAASTTEAYFRGGQRIPAWVAGLSIFATMLSALTFMGIPAQAFRTDISWYVGQLPILLIVPLVAVFYLPFFRKLNLTSAYEYLEQRFSLACRLFASLSFTAFHIGRIAIVIYLPALALAGVSDINVTTAILVVGVLCVIYTVIGGLEAVVWTDAIQAIILMLGAALCFVLAVLRVDGGLGGMIHLAREDNKLLEGLQWASLDVKNGTLSALVLFVAFFFNSFVTYTSSQDVVQRYVSTPDMAAARSSLRLTMWMSVFGSLMFFLLGTAMYAFYKTHPAELDPTLPAADSILPYFIVHELPRGLSGIVIAAIFAAAQSTISSSLNSVATTFVKDIDSRLWRPGRDDKTYLGSAKLVVLLTGLAGTGLAMVMAYSSIQSAFGAFNSMIGLTAGSLGGLFALGIFTRRANGTGALAGAAIGIAVVLALSLSQAPVTGLLYAAIGLLTCFVSGYLLSLALSGRGDSTLSIHH